MLPTSSRSPYCAAAAASTTVCWGGIPRRTATSPKLTSASTSATRSSVRRAIAVATLIATVLLPTPPFVEKTTTSCPVLERTGDGAGVRLAVPASISPTRPTACPSAAASFTATVSRTPARSAAWSNPVEASSTATIAPRLGYADTSRLICWNPYGLARPGPNTATTGRPGCSAWTSSSTAPNCAAVDNAVPSRIRWWGSGSTMAVSYAAGAAGGAPYSIATDLPSAGRHGGARSVGGRRQRVQRQVEAAGLVGGDDAQRVGR